MLVKKSRPSNLLKLIIYSKVKASSPPPPQENQERRLRGLVCDCGSVAVWVKMTNPARCQAAGVQRWWALVLMVSMFDLFNWAHESRQSERMFSIALVKLEKERKKAEKNIQLACWSLLRLPNQAIVSLCANSLPLLMKIRDTDTFLKDSLNYQHLGMQISYTERLYRKQLISAVYYVFLWLSGRALC